MIASHLHHDHAGGFVEFANLPNRKVKMGIYMIMEMMILMMIGLLIIDSLKTICQMEENIIQLMVRQR